MSKLNWHAMPAVAITERRDLRKMEAVIAMTAVRIAQFDSHIAAASSDPETFDDISTMLNEIVANHPDLVAAQTWLLGQIIAMAHDYLDATGESFKEYNERWNSILKRAADEEDRIDFILRSN